MIARRTVVAVLGSSCLLSLTAPSLLAASKAERIIVSGASGHVGQFAVKELLRRGVDPKNLILVSHNPAKLADYVKMGASVRYGDLFKPETLASAYTGGTRMLLISPLSAVSLPRALAAKNGFDAAVKAGVKHIAYTSFIGADEARPGNSAPSMEHDPPVEHQQAENFLRASGAKWTILRNGFYLDIYVPAAIDMAKTARTTIRPQERKSAPVTRADCGAAAAGALLNPSLSENRAFDITGPELIDRSDVARIVSQMTGKRIEVAESNDDGRNSPQGPPGAPLTTPQVVSDAVAKLAGRPPMGIKELLKANESLILASARGETVTLPPLYNRD